MRVRLAAFEYLAELTRLHGDVIPAGPLRDGFEFREERVRLKGIQGIFKPAILPEIPLSITTAPPEPNRPVPYDDGFAADGSLLRYRYRGTDPRHHQNVGLRRAMEQRRPLVYFHGVVKAEYFAAWPVYVVADDPANLTFQIAIDDVQYLSAGLEGIAEGTDEARREYITATTHRRLHQRAFRQRVLHAYRDRCALCRLKHRELLDAAHILPDSDPMGEPVVPNGLALCKLHHAAFDQDIIGIRPDLVIHVRSDILEERDGPMLRHGLQGFHEQSILIPRSAGHRPGSRYVEARYERFLAASTFDQ